MSNRFQERASKLLGGGGGGGINIAQWGGVTVAAATQLTDAMSNAPFVPLIGSRMEAFNDADNGGSGGWDRVRMGGTGILAAIAATSLGMLDLKVGGQEFSRVSHIASSTLPGGGAFTNQATFAIPSGVGEITFWVRYTRGAAGGFPYFRVLFGNGTEEGNDVVLNTSITASNNFGIQQLFEQQLQGPTPPDGNPINYVIATRVPRGATTIRMLAAEGGQIATPGTILITLAGGTLR